MRSRTFLALAVLVASFSVEAQPREVRPVVETQPVIGGGPVVEGAALWVHPTDPSRSLLLVADAQVGLITYQLDGLQEEWLSGGGVLGVDVQPGFPVGGITQQLVMVANQPLQGLVAYIMDPTTLRLRAANLEVINVPGFAPTRVALYSSPTTGTFYVFAGSATGVVRQFELTSQLDGGAMATPVRTFDVGNAVSGLVVDDALGWLYVTEQNNAIWRYGAEPAASDGRTLVEDVLSGSLVAPLGGLALYTASNGQGYLLAANGGRDAVRIYERQPPNTPLGDVSVLQEGTIDAVSAPRHVVVSNRGLGPVFPLGVVAVHDGNNAADNENFKLVPWREVAFAFSPPLIVDIGGGPLPDGGLPDGGGGVPGGPPGMPGQPGPAPGNLGCACSTASVSGSVLLVLAALLLLARRRAS